MARSNPLQVRLEEAVRQASRGELVHWSGQPSARRAFMAASPFLLLGVPCAFGCLFVLGVLLFTALLNGLGSPVDWLGVVVVAGSVLFFLFFVLILLLFILV